MRMRIIHPVVIWALFVGLSSTVYAAVADESRFDQYIDNAAQATGVDPHLIKAVIKQESHFREDIANGSVVSSAGAIGAMQLMPGTARQMGFTPDQMKDPETNIMAGAKYLQYLKSQPYIGNNILKILAGYNAGPGSVRKYAGVPPFKETVPYVIKASQYYAKYAGIPPLDVSSVPPPSRGIPGGGKGHLLLTAATPSANLSTLLTGFDKYTAITSNNLQNLLASLVGAVAFIFLALQVLLLWKDAISGEQPEFSVLLKALGYTLRAFFVVMVLFQFIKI